MKNRVTAKAYEDSSKVLLGACCKGFSVPSQSSFLNSNVCSPIPNEKGWFFEFFFFCSLGDVGMNGDVKLDAVTELKIEGRKRMCLCAYVGTLVGTNWYVCESFASRIRSATNLTLNELQIRAIRS